MKEHNEKFESMASVEQFGTFELSDADLEEVQGGWGGFGWGGVGGPWWGSWSTCGSGCGGWAGGWGWGGWC